MDGVATRMIRRKRLAEKHPNGNHRVVNTVPKPMANALADCEHLRCWKEPFEDQCLVWIGLQMACDLFERTVMMKAHGTAPVQGNEFDVHYIETGRAVFLLSILVSIGMKSAWRYLLSLHVVNVTGRPTAHCAFSLKLAAFVPDTFLLSIKEA